MHNCVIYAIPCYAEFQNSRRWKFNGNILYFSKPRITGKFNGNFNGILVINGINGNNPEIPKFNVNSGQNPGNSGQSM